MKTFNPRRKLLPLAALGLALTVTACGDDEDVTGPEEDNSIVGTASSAGDFTTLLSALDAANLTSTLQGGEYTVFAPTDAAFNALPAGVLDSLLANTDALESVLTYHVVSGEYSASELEQLSSIQTLQGQPIVITQGSVVLNGVTVSESVSAENGIIHVIDDVLLPPELDIVETAAATATFSTLATAVEAAGLVETLQGDGPFTVFAPTDAAFAALPDGTLDDLLADPTALAEVLTYHVVSGRVYARDLDGVVSTETVAGYPVLFDLSDGAKINGKNISGTDILATNGVIHVIDEVLLLDIVQQALSNDDFSTLVTAVETAGLVETLRGDGPFTVFAPTNAAFDALPEGALSALLADTDALTEVLLYHVVEGSVFAADLDGVVSAETLAEYPVLFDLSDGAMINESNITVTDIFTRNGVIHVIDAVLLPPEGDIVETAVAAGFSTLAAALQAAELVSALQAEGPFTVFAPTDAAFGALAEGVLDDLLLPENQSQLQDILLYHVVNGQVFSGNLTDGATPETLQGQTVTVDLTEGVMINDANVTSADIITKNGVIHVIDAVLLPESN